MTSTKRKLLIWAVILLVVLTVLVLWVRHGNPSELSIDKTTGPEPVLVEADSEWFPSVGLADTVGWKAGETPKAAEGLAVTRFAEGLAHPRTMLTLPGGDVLVALTNSPARIGGGVTGYFQRLFMDWVGAGGVSPNRIVLLRDGDGDGRAEQQFTFREKDMDSPSGMAFGDRKLYIANHDALLAFDFTPGGTALSGTPTKVMDLPGGGNHWMRNVLLSEDGQRLFVAVGSSTNIADNGIEAEKGRAAIWEVDLVSGRSRQFAAGLRNPNGMAWNPSTGELWTVVNERDMLGPDLVPDYLTNVPVGAQYGWPWVYWKEVMDWRVEHPVPIYITEYARKPEYALGAHTAPLGLAFSAGGNLMGEPFANGAFIARHGSWNRKPLSGYDVIYVPFDERGNPAGMPKQVLGGFLTAEGDAAHGRPVWLAWDKTGGLLVSDDTGGVVWRVASPGAKPSARPAAVVVDRMPALHSLEGDAQATFRANDNGEDQ